MLEAAQHDSNSFVTLTYNDDNLPGDNSVSPRELSLFFKRLRKRLSYKVRYFGCGEYGEKSKRPHYHLAIFGAHRCQFGVTRTRKAFCCEPCAVLHDAWGLGQILQGELNATSAAYVAGYIMKKMTRTDDARLEGRLPEFARMSLRPGIGLGMAHEIASSLMASPMDERYIDVPLSLQHGRSRWPLGRYLRRKLRTYVGRPANAPALALAPQAAFLQDVRETAWTNQTPVKAEILKRSLGKRRQIEARERRYRKRETI